jgi:signal transduction histidine kinase
MAHTAVPKQTTLGDDRSIQCNPGLRVPFVALGLGLVSFVATEVMHYLLVPDLGRRWERWLAEGVSAAVVALLTARLMHVANQRREQALLRMQVISEMNHHIRNALSAIVLSTDSIQNQQCIRVISESVDRIEWSLKEILLRRKPLPEQEEERLRYFQGNEKQTSPGTTADIEGSELD